MKGKILSLLITLIAVSVLFASCSILGSALRSKVAVEVSWDEALTTGVTRITNDGLPKSWVRVSPDGNKLLYTEGSARAGLWQIMYLRDANNPAKTPLVGENAYSPSWYTDNNQFVYISQEAGSGRLVRSSVNSGGRTYISRSAVGQSGDDTPSIRNGIIVFTAISSSGRLEIATIKENGTETTFLGEGRSPSWHPTQDKIIFIRNVNNPLLSGGDIFEMDIRSGQVTQIYSDPKFFCYEPSYSPDGRRVLFTKGTTVRTRGTVSTGGRNVKGTVSDETVRRHIFVMTVDGANVSPVSSGNASVISPSWGRDGEVFCLVGSGSNRNYEIFKMRIRGE